MAFSDCHNGLLEVLIQLGSRAGREGYKVVTNNAPSGIVLAASRGAGVEAVTRDRPKVMLPVSGKPLLRWLVDAFKIQGVNDITVVDGYRANVIDTTGVKVVVNERYDEAGELESLRRALSVVRDDMIVSYGDLLLRGYILRDLIECEAEFCVVVDSASPLDPDAGRTRDHVCCTEPDDRALFGRPVQLLRLSTDPADGVHGRRIGLVSVRGAGVVRLAARVEAMGHRADFDRLDLPDLINALVEAGTGGTSTTCTTSTMQGVRTHMIQVGTFVEQAVACGFAWYAGVLDAAVDHLDRTARPSVTPAAVVGRRRAHLTARPVGP